MATTFLVITIIAAIISMVCYTLYYDLDKIAGWIDGMIPLILAAVVMLGIALAIVKQI